MQAVPAYGDAAYFSQGRSADAAISGEEEGKKSVRS